MTGPWAHPRSAKERPCAERMQMSIVSGLGASAAGIDEAAARRFIEASVAIALHLPVADLTGSSRGRAPVAFARQVAMYVAHVGLGLTLTDAGRLFGRDRTTAAYACRLIEDRRDDSTFDLILTGLEGSMVAWLRAMHALRHNTCQEETV